MEAQDRQARWLQVRECLDRIFQGEAGLVDLDFLWEHATDEEIWGRVSPRYDRIRCVDHLITRAQIQDAYPDLRPEWHVDFHHPVADVEELRRRRWRREQMGTRVPQPRRDVLPGLLQVTFRRRFCVMSTLSASVGQAASLVDEVYGVIDGKTLGHSRFTPLVVPTD